MTNMASRATLMRIIGLIVALFWVVLLRYGLPLEPGSVDFSWHRFLIDSTNDMFPGNVQVMMWFSFFFCVAELLNKWFVVQEERAYIEEFSLYENPNFITINSAQFHLDPNEALKPELLAAIYMAKRDGLAKGSLIAEMFRKINHQFHSTNDVGDVYSAVTAMLEMKLHTVELRYTVVRYLAWLIPTLGFIGTVIGIAVALGTAGTMGGTDPNLLKEVIPLLGSAFYTTLLALLLSAVVMIMLQVIQAQDEETVNNVGQFCLDNIVTNLKPRSNG